MDLQPPETGTPERTRTEYRVSTHTHGHIHSRTCMRMHVHIQIATDLLGRSISFNYFIRVGHLLNG